VLGLSEYVSVGVLVELYLIGFVLGLSECFLTVVLCCLSHLLEILYLFLYC